MSTITAWGRTRRDISTIVVISRMLGGLSGGRGPKFLRSFPGNQQRIWCALDNPSKTTIQPGFNEQTSGRHRWPKSFLLYRGRATTDEIYAGYRLLTGIRRCFQKERTG